MFIGRDIRSKDNISAQVGGQEIQMEYLIYGAPAAGDYEYINIIAIRNRIFQTGT